MEVLHPEASIVDAATAQRYEGAVLHEMVATVADDLATYEPGVVFVRAASSIPSIVAYLAARTSGRPVALLDPALPEDVIAGFVERYLPLMVVGGDPGTTIAGYEPAVLSGSNPVLKRIGAGAVVPHPDLALLLATSGSTGDPRLVRLSRDAIAANTAAIVDTLGIGPGDVAITALPIFYSYGMSVLNTHLAAGATVVVTADGLITRGFWEAVDGCAVSTLPLVPMQFEMLERMRFDPARHPSLRSVTQAGGRLAPHRVVEVHERLSAVGARLFVMYGQTEGGPRLTTLPPERLPEKAGSVGPPLPGGVIEILADDDEQVAAGATGQVVYRGPNVMMGYAETASDLALGDTQGGVLRTGDLGHLDGDGYLTIDGRISRLGKAFGIRLNLDDLERMLARIGPVATTPGEDRVVVWLEGGDRSRVDAAVLGVARRLRIHPSGFVVRTVDRLPLLANGKIDYRALEHST